MPASTLLPPRLSPALPVRPVLPRRVAPIRLQARTRRIWDSPDFLCFWRGESISLVGSELSAMVLPLLATVSLHATAFQVAMLAVCTWAPYAGVTLFAGVWVDRWRRRRVLLVADVLRAGLLVLIPLGYLLGHLQLALLYLVTFGVGTGSVLFLLAYNAYVPSLVPRRLLLPANGALEASASCAKLVGPALGSFLLQWFAAPLLILLDAGSFLGSAFHLVRIRQREPVPTPTTHPPMGPEIRAGVRLVLSHPLLRALLGMAVCNNLFEEMVLALWVVFAVRTLHLPAAALGGMLGIGSLGAIGGALLVPRLERRLGRNRVFVGAVALSCSAYLLVALAGGPPLVSGLILILAFAGNGAGQVAINILLKTTRQQLVAPHLMGRVLASFTCFSLGAVPLGALVAGLLQMVVGLRGTLILAALGSWLGMAWLLPLLRYREPSVRPRGSPLVHTHP